MATNAHLAEKVAKEHEGRSLGSFATPAQLAEKAQGVPGSSPPSYSVAISGQVTDNIGAGSSMDPFVTPSQLAENVKAVPPPLPPRALSVQALPVPIRDNAQGGQAASEQQSKDPRSTSPCFLIPSEPGRHYRRTLLNVFIHGFLGNESSFQNFPVHIHNLLTATLAETHLVHTKIYPRYKSRKAIDFARDDFSAW